MSASPLSHAEMPLGLAFRLYDAFSAAVQRKCTCLVLRSLAGMGGLPRGLVMADYMPTQIILAIPPLAWFNVYTLMERVFSCGHEHQEPRNMGRGMARDRRLQEYFSRACLTCALKLVREQVQLLTDSRGNRMPTDYYTRKEVEAVERVKRTY